MIKPMEYMKLATTKIALPLLAAVIANILAACTTMPPEQRIDNVPMYGQPEIPRPDFLKAADDTFINDASAAFGGSREAASKAWAYEGDKFMNALNLDYAMRRYNQSWLLNPNNYHPYWGFGRVLLQRGDVDKAIGHFVKANQLIDDEYQKVALLADMATAYSVKGNQTSTDNFRERTKYFGLANKHFEESIKLDPNYPNSWRSWARSLYYEGRYKEAWDKIHKARTLGAPEFPASFIKALEDKMPEPK